MFFCVIKLLSICSFFLFHEFPSTCKPETFPPCQRTQRILVIGNPCLLIFSHALIIILEIFLSEMCVNNSEMNSGMKRSLPCLDLISLAPDDSLLSLMTGKTKCCLLSEQEYSSKKQRICPLHNDATPATEALKQFLRFGFKIDENPIPELTEDESFDLGEQSNHLQPTSCSLNIMSKSKVNIEVPNIHSVTQGMAKITASF